MNILAYSGGETMKKIQHLGLITLLMLGLNNIKLKANSLMEISRIDTLILYSQEVEEKYQGEPLSRINHIIEETNQRYKENGLSIQLNPVKIKKYPMQSNLSSKEIISKLQDNQEIKKLRESYGADQVLIYRLYRKEEKSCGIAYVNSKYQSKYAFAHVAINCSSYHTSHELGHSMGLYHSEKINPDAGYARGYGVEGNFATIMAYKANYHGEKIYKFSNPDIDCKGLSCGVKEGEEHEANAFKALLISAPIIATFKKEQKLVEIENINKANVLISTYKKAYKKIEKRLKEIQNQFDKAKEKYQKRVDEVRSNMDAYYDKKHRYVKLKKSSPKNANFYYKKYLKPIINSHKKSTFTELYLLETKLNKLKLSYTTYKKNIYLPAKKRLNEAEENYLKIQKQYLSGNE